MIMVLSIFACNFNHALADSKGKLCIGPINNLNYYNESFYKDAPPGYSPPKYSIQIDNGEIVRVEFNKTITYPPLALEAKHLVKIWRNDKLYQSFWFNFEDLESNELCLWHKPRYDTWSLWNLQASKYFCKCAN